jgi:hypothetical protein
MNSGNQGELYRAGQLFDLVSYYRNDKTPTAGSDPHGFLLDPRLSAAPRVRRRCWPSSAQTVPA